MGRRLSCKHRRIRPNTFALTQWPRQFLHEGHAATKSNRFPEHCHFVASLVLRRGSFRIADRRLLALPQLVGTRNPGCTTKMKFPRRIRSLHCIKIHASARLADVLCRRNQPRFLNSLASISLRLTLHLYSSSLYKHLDPPKL